jgi:hypothetical protein
MTINHASIIHRTVYKHRGPFQAFPSLTFRTCRPSPSFQVQLAPLLAPLAAPATAQGWADVLVAGQSLPNRWMASLPFSQASHLYCSCRSRRCVLTPRAALPCTTTSSSLRPKLGSWDHRIGSDSLGSPLNRQPQSFNR